MSADSQNIHLLNPDVRADHRTTLHVAEMDCPDEIKAIQRGLKEVQGVRSFEPNLMTGKVTIQHDARLGADDLIGAIGKVGLSASQEESAKEKSTPASNRRLQCVVASGVLALIGLVVQWAGWGGAWASPAIFSVAIVTGGWFIFPKAISAARQFRPDMNLLMTIAVLGAVGIQEWSEAAMVTFLFSLSELLESFSVARARRAIQSLMALSPETALLKKGEQWEEVPVGQVQKGDRIAVKSGARIPLDGRVVQGESSVNQAPITGESLPVEKTVGTTVYAGTINGEGSMEIQVAKVHTETTLARIIHLVEEAQSQKAPSQRFVDVFARYYTPAVLGLAVLVFLVPPLFWAGGWQVWFYRALVLLVIACPCALVISTPVSIVSGLTAMARRGVLIKGGAVLETIGKLKALAVDKTGTITEGKPRVTHVISVNAKPAEEILRIAAGIDRHSQHALARAVLDYAGEKGIEPANGERYRALSGLGAEAVIDGHEYFVGNHRLTHDLAVCSDEVEQQLAELEDRAQSIVLVGHKPHANCPGEVLGILAVGDSIRPGAREAIEACHRAGIKKVLMLSGDNQRTVDAIAREAGIDEAYGELLPDQKIERVKELTAQYHQVGMVGDGVNDAPAMAAASVGIAMGAVGSDTAIEASDIALMKDDLAKVAETVVLGRRTLRVIQANIAFALIVKAVFLVLAILGYTSLWLAILADTGATLVVIANALRLLRVKGWTH